MDTQVNFIKGKMNKSVDERLVPPGQYIDGQNIRLGSTETTEIGAVENSKGNTQVSFLLYSNQPLSVNAKCIGAFADGINQTMYWFVHDPQNGSSPSGKVDLIVSYNASNNAVKYLVLSETVLNFQLDYLITGVDLIDDLLFFTDNINPPRVINVERDYPYPNGGDNITEDDISVIVRPPGFTSYINQSVIPNEINNILPAPKLSLFLTESEEENYLVDKFLCFSYRYRYADNRYSALSLFTNAAFNPKSFKLDYATHNNEGMENEFNTAEITVSTGDNRVVGFDIVYKESGQNNIYLIERYDKALLGIANDSEHTITFGKKKIYTTIGGDELLRTFDNVPKLAKAQTIQGNRLIYGNYIDGYDLIDSSGLPVNVNYTTELISVSERNVVLKSPVLSAGSKSYNITSTTETTLGSIAIFYPNKSSTGATIFFGSDIIPSGSVFNWEITYRTIATQVDNPNAIADIPTLNEFKSGTQNSPLSMTFTFITSASYGSVESMLNSTEFANAVGVSNFQPINNATAGGTLTDLFNRNVNPPSSTNPGKVNGTTGPFQDMTHTLTGVSSQTTDQGFRLFVSGDQFFLTLPAVNYSFTDANGDIATYSEYFAFIISSMSGTYDQAINKNSLHSNRDYSLGMIYMDDYGRSSTVLTNQNNTIHIGCSESANVNNLKAYVYSNPPAWAKRYKFAIKPSGTTYETIYVTNYFADFNDNRLIWFRLLGEDQAIITSGTRLIVKADSVTVIPELLIMIVLDVESKERGLIDGTPTALGTNPPGLYFSAKPNGWTPEPTLTNIIDEGTFTSAMFKNSCGTNPSPDQQVVYPLYTTEQGATTTYNIAEGALINLDFRIRRSEYTGVWTGPDDRVKSVNYRWRQEYTSNGAYANFVDWWNGQDIFTDITGTLDNGQQTLDAFYVGSIAASAAGCNIQGTSPCYSISYQFIQDVNGFSLCLSSGVPRGGPAFNKKEATISMKIEIVSTNNVITFETEPQDADPNIFYEDAENFNIEVDLVSGNKIHFGNEGNQTTAGNPAVCNLSFMNCYAFGNGVESFKILDEVTSNEVAIGERTSAVSVQAYKESKRQASLTYSGIYSGVTNLNNSNEFNLGLANFKDLELSFGPIMKLHSRETDILTLQEDKISYVLANKDLISDSSGTGQIIAVPLILGQQIARIEEYGISFNPESFVSWGKDFYFTDTKRGAVIKLTGTSQKNDAIEIISTYGMRSYFRDSFASQIDTQKLGGYDPYMDEYVLNNNPNTVIDASINIECGTLISQTNKTGAYTFTVDVGAIVGRVPIDFIVDEGSIDITVSWEGTTKKILATGTTSGFAFNGFNLVDAGSTFLLDGVLPGDKVRNITTDQRALATSIGPSTIICNAPIWTALNQQYEVFRLLYPTVETRTGETTNGVLNFYKTLIFPTKLTITVTPSTPGDAASYRMTPNCIPLSPASLTQIVLTSPQQAGQELHYEYQWNDTQYYSNLDSNLVRGVANAPQAVSAFNKINGALSQGLIPYTNTLYNLGSTVTVRSNKLNTDSIDFNINENKFYIYRRADELYPPGSPSLGFELNQLSSANEVTPISNPSTGLFQVSKSNINLTGFPHLVVVTDLRDYSYNKLGYSVVSAAAACADTVNCSSISTTRRHSTSFDACADTTINISRYTNAVSAANITIGSIIYQNSPCVSSSSNWTPNGFYKYGSSNVVLQVGNDGLVINIINC